MSVPQVVNTVLITGATGSIGGALARAYASPGRTLVLQGRDEARLQEVAVACTAQGAQVHCCVMDIRERDAWMAWLGDFSETTPLDLVIVNAGLNTNIGADGAGEPWGEVMALMDVNLLGAMATVQGVLPAMRRRRQGQLALLSSLAAYYGLPITPAYCASKAGVKAYGEALRGWLAPEGVQVNVIMPGYVVSKMCHDMPGPKPFLWSSERAAQAIRRGLAANRARISFPFPLNLGCWFLAVMPSTISAWFLRRLHYGA